MPLLPPIVGVPGEEGGCCTLSTGLTRVCLYLRVFVHVIYTCVRRGREGGVERERKKTREVEWLRETASPVRGEEERRKDGHNGKWYSIIPDGHRGISLALPPTNGCCLVKSFSNIFSPFVFYIYILISPIHLSVADRNYRERKSSKLIRQPPTRLRSFPV